MPDTVNEFYDSYWVALQSQAELNALQPQIDDTQTLLTDLSTPSRVAEHRLWLRKFSEFSWMQKQRFNEHRTEMEAIAARYAYGTPMWWEAVMKTYQHGYSLGFVNNRPTYAVTDDAARVVKRSACISLGGGQVLLKAAGNGVPLSGAEGGGLNGFCQMIRPAGLSVSVIYLNADRMRLTATAYVNPLVFNPDGSLILSPGTWPVEDAINAYLAEIPFNGTMGLTSLVDRVQAVPGVVDFQIQGAIGLQGTNTFNITRLYPTVSGWILEDDTLGNTFRNLIGYTQATQ